MPGPSNFDRGASRTAVTERSERARMAYV